MIELMVVVVIIAILAAIAVPLFGARIRERRVQQTAGRVAELFRGARTRALGRGAAITVSVSGGSFTVLEGVQGTAAATAAGKANCDNLPTRGCVTNDWGNRGAAGVVGTARVIDEVTMSGGITAATSLNGTAQEPLNVCFSPAGRAFVNVSSVWTPASWTVLNQVVTVRVTNPDANRHYDVVLLPNGAARLGL